MRLEDGPPRAAFRLALGSLGNRTRHAALQKVRETGQKILGLLFACIRMYSRDSRATSFSQIFLIL